MTTMRNLYLTILATLSLPALANVDFASEVQPILSENCFACHGPDEAAVEAGLRFDQRELALAGGDSGQAIVPGDAKNSLLIKRISLAPDDDDHMPPAKKKKPLTAEQKDLLIRWIDEGAKWGKHWAFVPPERPLLPKIKDESWPENAIDFFVKAKLEAEGLDPSPKADPRILLRRRSLDLIGLPPTLEQIKNPEQTGVDQLLASPHYGEKWGREWLDVARYADSSGYEKDLPREMHFYRDWVVQALNEDMGYDDFIIRQIAGDLLPNATTADRIATGYLRNSMTNEEGGAKPEQFRIEGLFDRMDAIGKGVLGITTQCAQCHTHKYDPLTHDEYFGLFAYLNNMRETSLPAYSASDLKKIDEIKTATEEVHAAFKNSAPDWPTKYQAWQDELLQLPKTNWQTQPIKQFGDDGQKYQNLPDGSVMNQGYAATKMSAPFEHRTSMPLVRSVRLELLNDPYLALHGPGRSMAGTAALSEFQIKIGDKNLSFKNATASVNPPVSKLDPKLYPLNAQRGPDDRTTGSAEFAIDGKEKTAWTTDQGFGRSNVPQVINFELTEPLELAEESRLVTYIVQKHGGWNSDDNQTYNIGRFKMSFSGDLPNALDALPPKVYEALFAAKRTPGQEELLFQHWISTVPEMKSKIDQIWSEHPKPAVALVAQKSKTPRETRLFERGEQTQPKHVVEPHVPAFLHPLPEGDPGSRLTMAKWLVDRKSPTTARTAVNRIWQSYFGTGLVDTAEDLGLQSPQPSHPELLDWLAVEFMENDWSLKHLHRLIVQSATYQQSSVLNSILRERDPNNRLLARSSRLRVSAETIRDIQLRTSGLINLQLGGRCVFPLAPDFLFEKPSSYGPKIWDTETDRQRYRRALYTFRFRSVTHPMLVAFDAPSGEASCTRRTISTTPLQALVTLNEPMSVEAAVGLGHRILTGSIAQAFEVCTSRPPTPEEIVVLKRVFNSQLKNYQENPELAKLLIENHKPVEVDLSEHSNPELAAATSVAQVLLNLDETITKN